MMAMLMLAPAAWAQGNDISCPEGSAANAAGTQCTDLATGQPVEPISQTLVNLSTSLTNPCPEIYTQTADGTCVRIGTTPPASAASTLPTTGGLSPLVPAGVLLVGSAFWR